MVSVQGSSCRDEPPPGAEEQPLPEDEERHGEQPDEQLAAELDRLMHLRLTPDAMALEICLWPGSGRYPLGLRAALALRRIAAMGIGPMPEENALRGLLSRAKDRQWLTVATGSPPVPPVHGSLAVCVPALRPAGKDRFHLGAPVRRGDTIVRISAARDGLPGRDLKGRVLPSAPARMPAIPAGEHTQVIEDEEGPKLAATCDGMLYFDRMKFNVRPMRIVAPGELAYGGKLEIAGPAFVPGSIPAGASIVAAGDIVVAGDVEESALVSTGGSVTVLGCASGHHRKHASVRAALDANLASALYVDVTSGQDVYLQTQARSCAITAARHLIVLTRLRSALYDVDLRVGGAVVPVDAPGSPPDIAHDDLPTYEEACEIPAQAGMWEDQDIAFHPGTIHTLSVARASMTLAGLPPMPANKPVFLTFVLPGARPIHLMARTLPPSKDRRTMVELRQVSHQDEGAITAFCSALARWRAASRIDEAVDEAI